jgi:hypothetical protein
VHYQFSGAKINLFPDEFLLTFVESTCVETSSSITTLKRTIFFVNEKILPLYRRVSWPLTVSMANSIDVSNIDDDERRGKLSPKALRRHSRNLGSVNLSDLPISGDSEPPIGLLVQANPDTLGS